MSVCFKQFLAVAVSVVVGICLIRSGNEYLAMAAIIPGIPIMILTLIGLERPQALNSDAEVHSLKTQPDPFLLIGMREIDSMFPHTEQITPSEHRIYESSRVEILDESGELT